MRDIKIRFILYSLILALCVSCDKEQTYKQKVIATPVFPSKQKLEAKTFELSKSVLVPSAMISDGNNLIILDSGSDTIFKIFDRESLKFKFEGGVKGQGPGELMTPVPSATFILKDTLEIQDQNKLKKFLIRDNGLNYSGFDILPMLNEPVNRLVKLNEDIYFANDVMNSISSELIKINIRKSQVELRFGKYYDDGLNLSSTKDTYTTYQKTLTADPKNNRVAAFYLYFNRFKIFDSQGELLHDVRIKDKEFGGKDFSFEGKDVNVIYNVAPVSDSKSIFTLQIGRPKNDVFNNYDSFKPNINVWSWSGEPIAQFELDKPIVVFTVWENKLYGMSMTNSNHVYVYDLSAGLEYQ